MLARSAAPDALADAICLFFREEWSRALTPERLHQFVRERYSWDKHVQETRALYASLLAGALPAAAPAQTP